MYNYVVWSCDYKDNSGEGQLARKFIKSYFPKDKIKLIYPKSNFLFSDYIHQIYGIFVLWYFYLQGKKTVYLNYLPLWNIFIFFFVPPKTIFGPITGSIQINKIKSLKSFVRFKVFPLLYKISLVLLNYRVNKIIFASNILINFINKDILKKTEFNFILNDFKKFKNKSKKKIDLIVYYRSHENKFFDHHKKFIKKFINKKKKVVIVGDYLNIDGVYNFGRVTKKKILKLIKTSKYTLSGDDNLLSLFNIECMQYNVKIIFNNKLKFQKKKLKLNNLYPYNFEKKS